MHNRHSAGDVLNTMSAAFLYLTKHLLVLILDWVGLEAKAAFFFKSSPQWMFEHESRKQVYLVQNNNPLGLCHNSLHQGFNFPTEVNVKHSVNKRIRHRVDKV